MTEPAAPPPALFRRFPEAAARIPWLPLGRFPTPVEPLPLERFGDGHWIKRDDLSGTPYGGNKVRKLEWILAEARRRGATRLITAGAAGSHHVLATTLYGRAHGFEVTAVLFPQPLTDHAHEMLRLSHAHGAEIRYVRRMELVPLGVIAARRAHRAEASHLVAPGGSDPVGTLGYISGALELAEQVERGEAPLPEAVHVPIGTMGTAVGLAIGFALAGLPTRVRATRITGRLVTNGVALRRLAAGTLRYLQEAGIEAPDRAAVLERIHVEHRCIGRGYGHPTADCVRAAEVLGEAGHHLDPTYTAKAAVEFLDTLETRPSAPHLFWHTLSGHYPPAPPDAPPPDTLPEGFRRWAGP